MVLGQNDTYKIVYR